MNHLNNNWEKIPVQSLGAAVALPPRSPAFGSCAAVGAGSRAALHGASRHHPAWKWPSARRSFLSVTWAQGLSPALHSLPLHYLMLSSAVPRSAEQCSLRAVSAEACRARGTRSVPTDWAGLGQPRATHWATPALAGGAHSIGDDVSRGAEQSPSAGAERGPAAASRLSCQGTAEASTASTYCWQDNSSEKNSPQAVNMGKALDIMEKYRCICIRV